MTAIQEARIVRLRDEIRRYQTSALILALTTKTEDALMEIGLDPSMDVVEAVIEVITDEIDRRIPIPVEAP